MKSKLFILFFIPALLFLGCKNKSNSKKSPSTLTEENSMLIEDKFGEIRVPKSPKRVVIFHLGALDIFDELGIEAHVVGFPQHSVPDYLKKFTENDSIIDTGSLIEPNFRKINDLNPDLIIMGERQQKDHDEFSSIAPTLYYDMDYKNYAASITKNLKRIGKIYGLEKEAEAINEDMISTINANKASSTSSKGLVVMYNNGKFSAFGKNSRFGFAHDEFDVTPVSEELEASTHGNSISNEYIQQHDPDMLFVIDRNRAIGEGKASKSSIENPLVKETKAYKNNKIIYLSSDVWYLAGGGVQSMKIMANEIGGAY